MRETKTIHVARGVRLISREHLCGQPGCTKPHPQLCSLALGERRIYVGPELEPARDQLPLLVDERLQELGELTADAEVRDLAAAAARASEILSASRVRLREQGLGEIDLLVLPSAIVERLGTAEATVVAMLPVQGADQRALVERVRGLFDGVEHTEALAGALELRRHIGASPYIPIEPLTHFVDKRMRAFVSTSNPDLLERLASLDVETFAREVREERLGRRPPEEKRRAPRRVTLTGPLVLTLNSANADRVGRLDQTSGAALLVTNEEVSMSARDTCLLPFRIVRPLEIINLN